MARKSRFTMPPTDETKTPELTPRALTKQEFGRRLQALMIKHGWNQSDLGRRSGVGRDSISTYIAGKTFPTPNALQKLSNALGVAAFELLPNGMMNAMDDEHPAMEIRQAAGATSRVWIRLNRALSFGAAAKIISILDVEDAENPNAD